MVILFLASSMILYLASLMYSSNQATAKPASLDLDATSKGFVPSQDLKGDTLFELEQEKEKSVVDDLDGAVEITEQQGVHHAPKSNKNKGCTIKACTQQQRFDTLHKGCAKYPEITHTYNPDDQKTYFRLLVDDHHKILYCALPKAASTTFYKIDR